jgi:hypothetical protein
MRRWMCRVDEPKSGATFVELFLTETLRSPNCFEHDTLYFLKCRLKSREKGEMIHD